MFSTHRLSASLFAGTLVLLGAGAPAQDADVDRAEKILANLRNAYSQLAQMDVQMGSIGESAYGGLDQGSFTLPNGQTQKFLVSSDDKALYLVGDPIDVSRSAEQIAADVAARNAERVAQLEAAVAGQPFRGGASAAVTIVEFSDFECPYCQRGAQTVEQVLEKYGDQVKFHFKHFPLEFHPWARPAAIASHCAAEQSAEAFWQLHDRYFAGQKELNASNVLAKSKEYLEGQEIDLEAWSTCAEDTTSEAYQAAAAAVTADMTLGQKLGVSGTPGFFVNGSFLNGAQPIGAFVPLIEAALGGE